MFTLNTRNIQCLENDKKSPPLLCSPEKMHNQQHFFYNTLY